MTSQVPPSGTPGPVQPAVAVPWAGGRALVDVLVIYVGAQILAALVTTTLAVGGGDRVALVTVLLVLSPVASLLAALLWLRLRYPGRVAQVRGRRSWRWTDVGLGAAAGVACLIGQRFIVLVVAFVADRFGRELPVIQETFREIAQRPETVPALVLTTVLLAPVAEEVVFRGVLFQGLRARTGFWVAALLSAAVFTLAHLGEGGGLLAGGVIVSGILPLGVAFAALVEVRGSLLTAIVAHATYNAIGVAALILIPAQA